MKKRLIIGIATSLFAVALFFNTNKTDINSTVSMDDIANMAQASASMSFACPNGCLVPEGLCYCNGWVKHEEAKFKGVTHSGDLAQ